MGALSDVVMKNRVGLLQHTRFLFIGFGALQGHKTIAFMMESIASSIELDLPSSPSGRRIVGTAHTRSPPAAGSAAHDNRAHVGAMRVT